MSDGYGLFLFFVSAYTWLLNGTENVLDVKFSIVIYLCQLPIDKLYTVLQTILLKVDIPDAFEAKDSITWGKQK